MTAGPAPDPQVRNIVAEFSGMLNLLVKCTNPAPCSYCERGAARLLETFAKAEAALTALRAERDAKLEFQRARADKWVDIASRRSLEIESLTNELAELRARLAVPAWQPIETAPKDKFIIGALIRDGQLWRVHEMKHNGLAFYTRAGGSLPQMTHWMPLPPPPAAEGERP